MSRGVVFDVFAGLYGMTLVLGIVFLVRVIGGARAAQREQRQRWRFRAMTGRFTGRLTGRLRRW